jgi:AcrR family transcriptional regulator
MQVADTAARSHTPKGQRAREHILAAVEPVLAEHGFHGTSMRDVAAAAGLPLATVVYHFAKKEQLYAAVLGDIAAELLAGLANVAGADGLAEMLVRWTEQRPQRVRLLLREVLDNPSRLAKSRSFPLGPFLAAAAKLVLGGEVAVLHAIGGLSYVVAAKPTVDRIVGGARAKDLARTAPADARAFTARTLGVRPTGRTP